MTSPLSGLRVLDLTNVLAGPFCCHQLAHLGADVVKVEPPGRGDLARQLGADPELNARNMGVSFLAQNAGKRSVTIDLKHPRGRDLLLRLVDGADALVENFRPGVMDRLRLDAETLRARKPSLVYAAISGFGQEGPLRAHPAYDQIVQGASGVMAATGSAETAPLRVGFPLCDAVGGLTAAMAVCAALAARDAEGKRPGATIDVAMLDATLACMGWAVSNWLIAGVPPSPNGNENPTSAPSGTFRTADAPINIAANRDEQWIALARTIGREDLLANPDYATREKRKANRDALRADIEQALATAPAASWVERLVAAGVPTGPILDVPTALATPQVAGRGLVATHADVAGRENVQTVVPGLQWDGEPPRVTSPPPELGQHTEEVLREMGVHPDELAELREEGVL